MTKKRVPLRKCVVTNEMKPKEDLIRIVRNKYGDVFIDPSGKKNGRGAYLTINKQIINQAKKTNALSKQFRMKIDESIYDDLLNLLPDESDDT